MGKGDSFVDLDLDHEGKSTSGFLGDLEKRATAFKRQLAWSLTQDLFELVTDKIPGNRKYKTLKDSIKVGECKDAKGSIFAVYIDNKAKGIKKIDTAHTVIYIRPRRRSDKPRKDVQLLADNGPWTTDTIPFWPTKKDAVIIQRKVGKRIVDKVNKMQAQNKSKISRQLTLLGQKDTNAAISKRSKDLKNVKAIPDVAYEMLTMEFGGGDQHALAIWRTSLMELYPGRAKTVYARYKQLKQTLTDSRYKNYDNWPTVDVKVKAAQLESFVKFQKMLGK